MDRDDRIDKPELHKISVFGLGKLGACIAATLAARGFEVTAFDIDRSKTDSLARGIAPVGEPHLQETLARGADRLKATNDVQEAISSSEASFFIPATPSLPDGSFSNEYLIKAVESGAKAVRQQNKSFHLFVVNSTVTPGTLDNLIKPMLEELLMGRAGERFGLCYNPEFIALGDVIHGLLEPDFVLVGQSDDASGDALERLYRRFCKNTPPVERMSNINAELAKISVNCAVTTKISFVNQLSAVCAEIPGADPGVILRSIGKDRRIGSDYLRPGLGFGGPCFPRDNALFQYVARAVGVKAALAEATVEVNDGVNQRLLATVLTHCADGCPVGVLGLAYKPFTGVVDCSPGVWLSHELARLNRQVVAHDYMAGDNAAVLLGGIVDICQDPLELLRRECRVLVITCPWPAYKEFFASLLSKGLERGTILVDPWRLLSGVVAHRDGLRGLQYVTSLSAGMEVAPKLAAGI